MACRSMDDARVAAEEIKNLTGASDERLVVMQIDLSSLTSIRQFVEDFKSSKPHVYRKYQLY